MMQTHIKHRLDETELKRAAGLLLNALADVFRPVIGEGEKGLRLLERSINPDNCLVACENGVLAGILGYTVENSYCIRPSFTDITAIYGIPQNLDRSVRIALLDHKVADNEIYIEAVAVDEQFRSRGIGARLFKELYSLAEEKNCNSVTLQVIDINTNAIRFYEKQGFKLVERRHTWPVNRIIGWPFSEVFLMKKEL